MSNSMHADTLLAAAIARVENQLQRQLGSKNFWAGRLLEFAGAGRGKRLRARLTVLSAWALGETGRRAERLAVALELLHQATLVHDDVIDESRLRRHRPTLNARFGNQAAVLAGDLILVRAVKLLLQDGFPPRINTLVVRAVAEVCEGEIQELSCCRDYRLSAAQYKKIVAGKTASLLAAASACGAVLAGAGPARVAQMTRFGREFGMAFQIQDDLLDVTGRPAALGKPVGLDQKEGRVTLPVIFGLALSRGAQRRNLLAAVKNPGAVPGRLSKLLETSGALAQARNAAVRHARRAQQALAGLPDSPARAALLALAEFAADRNH